MNNIFINANVIDVINKKIIENCCVYTKDGIITEVTQSKPAECPEGCAIVDLEGKNMLPGLFNAHAHLTSSSEAGMSKIGSYTPFERTLIALKNAEILIKGGFTYVRDVGGHFNIAVELMNAVAKGKVKMAPDILASGNMIAMTGGCGAGKMAVEIDGADEARKASRTQIKMGARNIKLMSTGGVMTPGTEPGAPQLTIEELKAAIEEAHKFGIKTCTHAESTEGTWNALKAGIDCIEHGDGIDAEIAAYMAEHKIPLVGTISTCDCILKNMTNPDEDIVRKSLECNEKNIVAWKTAHDAGVICGCGSDAGTEFTYFDESYIEITHMVDKYGVDPMEALKIATINSAIICGVDKSLGSIECGKKAHLAIFAENPAEDIHAIAKCAMTIKNGEILWAE